MVQRAANRRRLLVGTEIPARPRNDRLRDFGTFPLSLSPPLVPTAFPSLSLQTRINPHILGGKRVGVVQPGRLAALQACGREVELDERIGGRVHFSIASARFTTSVRYFDSGSKSLRLA